MEVDRLLKRTILPKLGHLKAGEVEYRDVRRLFAELSAAGAPGMADRLASR